MHCSISLIVLALGYLVLAQAYKEKGSLKVLGQAVGVIVVIGAIVSILFMSMKCAGMSCPVMKGYCPMPHSAHSMKY